MADTKLSALTALTGANVDPANDIVYIADVSVTTGKKITVNELALGAQTVANWTPVLSSTSGTITTLGAASGFVTKIGRIVIAHFSVAITTNGTGTSSLSIAGLPYTSSYASAGAAREANAVGKMVQAYMTASATNIALSNYDNTYAGGDGYRFDGTVVYLTA